MLTEEPINTDSTEQIRWDLSDLYAHPDDVQLHQDKRNILERSKAFARRYCDNIIELSAENLSVALEEYEELEAMRMRVNAYCILSWTIDTDDPALGKLYSDNDAFQAEVTTSLRAFERAWANAPASVERHLDHPKLRKYRYYLKRLRLKQAHLLPEREEALLSQLSLSGSKSWVRFYEESTTHWRYPLGDDLVSSSDIEEAISSQDRNMRERASDAVHKTLEANSHALTFISNTVLLAKNTEDGLRGYDTWLSERNLGNEVRNEEVDALAEAVIGDYSLASRYYELFRAVLGYDVLYDYDLYVPLPTLERALSWQEAKATVLSAFESFNPEFADMAEMFFNRHWIDASPAEAKLSGAYGSSGTSSVHPYIFLNFRGRSPDLFTLAHELGHGLHYYLAREQGQLQYEASDTLAELASTFCEMLVFQHLLVQEENPAQRFALRMQKLQSVMVTVFQQMSFHEFECNIHTAHRKSGELSTEQISEAWITARKAMYGDSVVLRKEYSLQWGWVPHFLSEPGYVHTYAYGELLAWSLFSTYQQKSDEFVGPYLDVLRAGASASPKDILAPLGINLSETDTWRRGLSLVETFLEDTERDRKAGLV